MNPALLAHGGTLCPDEILAVSAAASLGLGFWIRFYWHHLKIRVGFWLIARHLAKCHGECNFGYYAPGKGILDLT